ncbi:hypothetical protein QBC34DRAFT_331723 [Podospora aff. communis PSN243]|uniref:FAD-binding PCMH-type domain-containing protein n=1 Tax=Podospora aff. communis PSN243 TaxID=3040156 RepID=A0AAV9GCM1_9PEZI|nr:hypothetical protein QBC34DRAFT_331723 [Podospora aff. communis PSN243]
MFSLLSVLLALTSSVRVHATNLTTPSQACSTIARRVSSATDITFPGALSPLIASEATGHWFLSSNEVPACVVEVASRGDLSIALQIIGASRTPFAVMSGGHASNPGFSSTKGVHISLRKLRQVVLSRDKRTVEIGFGQTWMDVFEKLDGTGYNVVGGRVPGPGVGGFTLGGGYSWKTNQYGLTCDTVVKFNLVLPNGTITYASDSHNQDLFFALKGGLNRFGVVTSAVLVTHKQPKVYGGYIVYHPSSVPALLNETARFHSSSTDKKTQIITTIGGSPAGNTALALFFHDGPEQPPSFRAFEKIPHLVSNMKSRSFLNLVQSIPSELAMAANIRGAFATFSTSDLTSRFLFAIKEECDRLGKVMLLKGGITVSYDIEPFTKYGEFATESAYPHGHSPLPLNLYFSWLKERDDDIWHDQMRASIEKLKQVAIEDEIYNDGFTQYPNYALAPATAEEVYGKDNAGRLSDIRRRIDPEGIMDSAGGFDI